MVTKLNRVVLNLSVEQANKLEAFLYANNQPESTKADGEIESIRDRLHKNLNKKPKEAEHGIN